MHALGTATAMYSCSGPRWNVAIEKPVQASCSDSLRADGRNLDRKGVRGQKSMMCGTYSLFHRQHLQRSTSSSTGSVIARPTDKATAAPSKPQPDQEPTPNVSTMLSATCSATAWGVARGVG